MKTKTSDIIGPPAHDLLVTRIGNCFEKFADALAQHMTTFGNQICDKIIDAMETSDNLRIDKTEVTKKRSHSSRAKGGKEDEKNSKCKSQNLIKNYYKDQFQIKEQKTNTRTIFYPQ